MSRLHVNRIWSVGLLACETSVYCAYSYNATPRDNRFRKKSIVPVSPPVLFGVRLAYVNLGARCAMVRITSICEFFLVTVAFIFFLPPPEMAPMFKKAFFEDF